MSANNDEIETYADFFIDNLPETEDLSLVVLKGHLIIEAMLDRYIEQSVNSPKYVEGARVGFEVKRRFARALAPDKFAKMGETWKAVKKLNVLRNDIAHNLESGRRDAKVDEFLKAMNPNSSTPDSNDERINEIKKTLAQSFGRLVPLIEYDQVKHMVKN